MKKLLKHLELIKEDLILSTIKCYSGLVAFSSFIERFRYLKLDSEIGRATFGGHRMLNQDFYHSKEWKDLRDKVILRDDGCDLGDQDRPIHGSIYIHHIEPLTVEDILNRHRKCLDPDNAICCSFKTHQAIHFSDESLLPIILVERSPNDTCPWR